MTLSSDEHPERNPYSAILKPSSARSRVTIERNGQEYLVTIDGVAYVALTRAQAEGIAKRRGPAGIRPTIA